MLKNEKIVLTSIGKDPLFRIVTEKLLNNINLNYSEKTYILACSILFIKYFEGDKRLTSYIEFAYFIILKYSLTYKDYKPLYDFSVNFGFYPIVKIILENNLLDEYKIDDHFINIGLNRFKKENNDIETLEQHIESKNFLTDITNEKSYLAPTSFGKSFLIIDYIRALPKINWKIAIIVPTKSLLVQTHKMIKGAELKSKIIIHDEMYDNSLSFIAIFTQERALRLLNKNSNLFFDVIFIDEAHNILKQDSRSILLSRLIAKNRFRNIEQKIVYLSPLIDNVNNLKISPLQNISKHSVNFNVKEPEIFEYKMNNEIFKYNRFLNQFYKVGEDINVLSYLMRNSKLKNFIYGYSPRKIELLARDLSRFLPEIEISDDLQQLRNILKREVHKDFYIIEYLKFGIIYLHGKLPDIIKEYLEDKFKSLKEIKYIIANTVILEGINLPIDCLFIFNTRGLGGKELINLIGRVNRLNNIFSPHSNNLNKLLPPVHFVNNIEYNCKNSAMENKIKLLRDRIFADEIENPTLNSFDFNNLKINKNDKENKYEKIKLIQENEKFLYSEDNSYYDKIKKYLIENGIAEFYVNLDVLVKRFCLVTEIAEYKKIDEWRGESVMDKIAYIFIDDVENISDFSFKRLKDKEARNYYENYILIGQKKSLNENIDSQYKYFKTKVFSREPRLYIGSSYGEESRESSYYPESKLRVYIDLSKKSDAELINLAIVKIKIEEDFISFKLNKFILMMYDYDLISEDEYNIYVYGTMDKKKINLTRYGLSISLISRLEKDEQLKNLSFDEFNNLVGNEALNEFKNNIDDFYRFEINRYLN